MELILRVDLHGIGCPLLVGRLWRLYAPVRQSKLAGSGQEPSFAGGRDEQSPDYAVM